MTYKDFCDWVASEIFSENWEFNKESLFEEIKRRLTFNDNSEV